MPGYNEGIAKTNWNWTHACASSQEATKFYDSLLTYYIAKFASAPTTAYETKSSMCITCTDTPCRMPAQFTGSVLSALRPLEISTKHPSESGNWRNANHPHFYVH